MLAAIRPAIELADGSKHWYLNGQLHRGDGPAYIGMNGHKQWYLNGKLHREDGPAIEYSDGSKQWRLNDQWLSEKEFNKWFRTKKGEIYMFKKLFIVKGI